MRSFVFYVVRYHICLWIFLFLSRRTYDRINLSNEGRKKNMKKRKIWHRILPFVLTVAMLAGFCPQGISFKDTQLTVPEVKAATTLKNPITIPDDSLEAGQRTT